MAAAAVTSKELFEADRARLQQRLVRRLLWLWLLLGAWQLALRWDWGPWVTLPALLFLAYVAAGLRWEAPPKYRRAYGWGFVLLNSGLLGFLSLRWPAAGVPPALVTMGNNGLLNQLCWGPALGWATYGLNSLGALLSLAWHGPLDAETQRLALDLGLCTVGLQGTVLAYEGVYSRVWRETWRQQRRLAAASRLRDRLTGVLLDNLELPLRWDQPLRAEGYVQHAEALHAGLLEARRLRGSMEPPPESALDLGTSRRLLLPLLSLCVALAATVGLRDWWLGQPDAWIGLGLAGGLGACLGYLWRRPLRWRGVAVLALLLTALALWADAAQTASGRVPEGLCFGSLFIAFAALWLGWDGALIAAAYLLALDFWIWQGRGAALSPAGLNMARNFVQQWVMLAAFLAPAAAAQRGLLLKLDRQRQELAASLRVRRRLLGTLYHDAANHVMALGALARQLQRPEGGDPLLRQRFAAIHARLAALVGSARLWLFDDEPFRPEQLSPVALEALGRSLGELFESRLSDKNLDLKLELPAGLAVRAVPVLLGDGVLGNLLSNAIKFSPRHGAVSLRAWRQGDWVCVAVLDQGPGFDPGQVDAHLRGLDVPSRAAPGGEGGQGLGLGLAAEHLRRMGGRLELLPDGRGGEARVWLRAA